MTSKNPFLYCVTLDFKHPRPPVGTSFFWLSWVFDNLLDPYPLTAEPEYTIVLDFILF